MDPELRNQVRKLVLNLLPTNTPTDEELREAVSDILPMILRRQGVEFDADEIVRTLQAEFNVFQADAVSLDNTDGHLEWLPDRRDSIVWRFWDRYLRYLQEEVRLPPWSFSDWTPQLSESSESLKTRIARAHGIAGGWWSGRYSPARRATIPA